MVRLRDFAEHIAAVSEAGSDPGIRTGDLEHAMRERQLLGNRIAEAAAPLHERIVRPMLDELTRRFANAVSAHYRTPSGLVSECRFTHTPRYPAAARVSIAIEWDAGRADVWLRYAAEMLPALIPHASHERRDIGLTPPGPAEVHRWTEAKLLGFLAAYLEIAKRAPMFNGGDVQNDPVCGMQVERGASPHSYTHDGHTYWLCSAVCRDVLAENPALFLVGRVDLGRSARPVGAP